LFLTIMKIYANWKERKRLLKEYDEQEAKDAAPDAAPLPEETVSSPTKDG